jgi:predicted Rossmann fold nucleotide-binding protein DprA/Smf involved in DNA uptake
VKSQAGEVRDRREVIREEQWMRRLILRELEEEPRTVPEIAAALGRPPQEVVFWVMGLRKYGFITEIKESDEDGYFRYRAAEKVT